MAASGCTSAMNKILLLEDDTAIAETLNFALQREGFSVRHCILGADALDTLRQQQFDVLIMDVGLPDINGFALCQRIRQFSAIPILFLTAHADTLEREMGFELGADDYVTKPFSLKEVVLRVRALLRRTQAPATPSTPSKAVTRGLVHDGERKQIRFNDQVLALTRAEYLLLVMLLAQPEKVFSREQLLQHLPNSDDSGDRVIDTLIKQLRSKLREAGAEPEAIVTHRGLGYSYSERAR